jgi:trk system potassium uptake protein
VAQMAKVVWNVDRALARVNDPDHEEIFRKVGIDETVNATSIIFALLEQQISPDVVLPVGALARGNLEVVEVVLGNRSPAVGKKVRELSLPPQTNLIWVLRGDQGLAVSGDTDLTPNDVVVAVVPRDHADELRETFLPERP